jgi:EAL domain-containing protein (putative c-di-GMP-specific phosphodiesterase class I)
MPDNNRHIDQVREERDRFVAFAFASADILMEVDENGTIIYTDGATMGLLGKTAKEIKGMAFTSLLSNQEDIAIAIDILSSKKPLTRLEDMQLNLMTAYEKDMPFAVSGFKLPYLKNHFFLTLSLLKSHIASEEFRKRDLKTGMFNKQGFVEIANQKILKAAADQQPVTMTVLDMEGLKAFLDSLPPEEAMALSAEISRYMKSRSLDGDTAGKIDEQTFSLVHEPGVDVSEVVNDIIAITRQADPTGKGIEAKAFSVDADPKGLTEQDSANALLYTLNKLAAGKEDSLSLTSLYDGYKEMLSDTVHKITEFRKTVAASEFQLAFQPIVDLKNGIIHHFESLVRFPNSENFANPFHFITFGEQAGIIGEFDLAMCQRVIDVLQIAATKGNFPKVSVNLSGRSLSSSLFMDALNEILRLNERVRKQIIFEVTESAKITDLKRANQFLQELRNAGNLCCLDDFGIGESSFEYIKSLQVDFVKIDGSYVKESLATQRGRHLLKAMASLCHDLGMVTIGEMVEDERMAGLLWESGVKFGQGYLFGKPVVDDETLVNCSKPNPFYHGIIRAKRIPQENKKPWH